MEDQRNRRFPAWAFAGNPKEKNPQKERALKVAWGLFLIIGLPLGLLAALGALAYAGVYVEPLRQFWRPWPPDIVKSLGAVAGFGATLAYLTYRVGRHRGYIKGAVAGTAAARNIAEGRGSSLVQSTTAETSSGVPDAGLPPPEFPPPIPPSQ